MTLCPTILPQKGGKKLGIKNCAQIPINTKLIPGLSLSLQNKVKVKWQFFYCSKLCLIGWKGPKRFMCSVNRLFKAWSLMQILYITAFNFKSPNYSFFPRKPYFQSEVNEPCLRFILWLLSFFLPKYGTPYIIKGPFYKYKKLSHCHPRYTIVILFCPPCTILNRWTELVDHQYNWLLKRLAQFYLIFVS
jgi:hypothetical protein